MVSKIKSEIEEKVSIIFLLSRPKQIIAFTHPHIGNTGINDEDNESDSIFASGIVIKDLPNHFSNWRAKQSLDSFLESNKTIGISNKLAGQPKLKKTTINNEEI